LLALSQDLLSTWYFNQLTYQDTWHFYMALQLAYQEATLAGERSCPNRHRSPLARGSRSAASLQQASRQLAFRTTSEQAAPSLVDFEQSSSSAVPPAPIPSPYHFETKSET